MFIILIFFSAIVKRGFHFVKFPRIRRDEDHKTVPLCFATIRSYEDYVRMGKCRSVRPIPGVLIPISRGIRTGLLHKTVKHLTAELSVHFNETMEHIECQLIHPG